MQRNRRIARLCAATAATLSVIGLTPAMASAGEFAGRKIIAPFFADVDTRGAGSNFVT